MLNALFGSEARVKIINIFFLYPDKKYSQQQIAQTLNLPPNSWRREIDNLLKTGVIKEAEPEENDKKKYFRINPDFILYPEISALFAKTQILFSQNFIINLQKICQPKLLILSGFFVNYAEAKTDLLLVGTVRREAFLKLVRQLEKELGREINFTIMTEREYYYRRDVMDIFLYNLLEGKKLILIDAFNKQE
jgi:DNA-binding Lrp family transcriptional regulator